MNWIYAFLLGTFLVSTTVAEALGNLMVLYVGYGAVGWLAVAAGLNAIKRGVSLPLEVGLYWGFAAWSVATGLVVSVDVDSFTRIAERVAYVGILFTLVSYQASLSRTPFPALLSLTIVGLILVAYGYVSGNFELASEVSQRGAHLVGKRATSLTSNANSLGMICMWGGTGLALLWGLVRRPAARMALAALVLPLLAGIVLSASRKAFLLVLLFGMAWLWFCYRSLVLRNLRVFVGVSIVGLAGLFFAKVALQDTMLGYRLGLAASTEKMDSSSEARLQMYADGLQIFLLKPITGVGLGQFAAYSESGLYAHSQYMEIVCNTGGIGALLYFPIYLLAWRRLRFVQRKTADPTVRYVAGVCLAALVCYVVVGLALVQYASFDSTVILGGIVGFAHGAQRNLRFSPVAARRRIPVGPGNASRPLLRNRPA